MIDLYVHWLRERGVAFTIADPLVRRDDFVGPLGADEASEVTINAGSFSVRETRNVKAAEASDHATRDVLLALDGEFARAPFDTMWEIGCGTGLLAIWAAKKGVAVVATDVSATALDLARSNASRAGVAIDWRLGAGLVPFQPHERAQLFVANLPHKPALEEATLPVSQHGGTNGDAHHRAMVADSADHLSSGGRILSFLHSLPTPALVKAYGDRYDLTLVSFKVRWFGASEYSEQRPLWRERARRNESYLVRDGKQEGVIGCVWKATKR